MRADHPFPMSEIKPIPEKDIDDFITIAANAYPRFPLSSEQDRKKFKQRLIKILKENEPMHPYGLYRKGALLGAMLLYDFAMNVRSVKVLAGGVGMVAVDLAHKKEKVCKDMITYFLKHYREKGAFIACLYPFRTDFYRKMGFGFGTKMHQYRIRPTQLPKYKNNHIQIIEKRNKKALLECYNRYMEKTHGMIEKDTFQLNRILDNPENRIVGYTKGNRILGYLVFAFKEGVKDNFIINDIEIKEFVYENRDALLELLTFLYSQHDQIRYVIINTQDEYFHHLFEDPRNDSDYLLPSAYHESNVSGVGLMYRVIDTKKLFESLADYNFGNQNCKLKLSVRDSFFRENEGNFIIHFENGIPYLNRECYDVEISLDISDFSSLIMGVVPFERLYQYGLVEISNPEYIDTVTRIFKTEEKPVCMTEF
jgi:predicted acetyltransferase